MKKMFLIMFLIGCGGPSNTEKIESEPVKPEPVFKDANVTICYKNIDTLKFPQTEIKNHNDFPITVLCAMRASSHGYGHEPIWVKTIPSKEMLYYCINPHFNGNIFFIYRSGAGDLIGLINTGGWDKINFYSEKLKNESD